MRQVSFVARLGEAIDDAYALQLRFRGRLELGDDSLDVGLWGGMGKGNLGIHVVDFRPAPRGSDWDRVLCTFSAEGLRSAAEPLFLLAQQVLVSGGGGKSYAVAFVGLGGAFDSRIAALVAVRSSAMPGLLQVMYVGCRCRSRMRFQVNLSTRDSR